MKNWATLPAQVATILSVAGVYFALESMIYLIGYWHEFNLNVFEYIGPGYLLTAAFDLFPILIPLVFILVYVTALWLLAPPPRPMRQRETRKVGYIVAVVVMIGLLLALRHSRRPVIAMEAFLGAIVMGAVVVLVVLAVLTSKHTDSVSNLLPNPDLTAPLAAIVLLAIPAWTYAWAAGTAWNAQHGAWKGLDVDIRGSGLQWPVNKQQPLYLGRLGDSYVLYETDSKRIIIVRTDKVSSLVLTPGVSK